MVFLQTCECGVLSETLYLTRLRGRDLRLSDITTWLSAHIVDCLLSSDCADIVQWYSFIGAYMCVPQ